MICIFYHHRCHKSHIFIWFKTTMEIMTTVNGDEVVIVQDNEFRDKDNKCNK